MPQLHLRGRQPDSEIFFDELVDIIPESIE
jgi:hypothetical protein